jgi:hypothetical protein
MPARAPPAISQGTRSPDPIRAPRTVAAPRAPPQPEQKRALEVNAVPQEEQKPELGEVTVLI